MVKKNIALTIAGFDPSGGAGILSDLKTFSSLNLYGVAVITAITAQNFTHFSAIEPASTKIVIQQLQAVLNQLPVRAIKIGMINSIDHYREIFSILSNYSHLPIIIDPVLKSTSGKSLIEPAAIEILKEVGFPITSLVTPNIAEAEILSGMTIHGLQDIKAAGRALFRRYKIPFLVKGGHLQGSAMDTLFDSQGMKQYNAERVAGINSHGSGCTLSSAITAFFARGEDLREAVHQGKQYITQALKNPTQLSDGLQVINHFPDTK